MDIRPMHLRLRPQSNSGNSASAEYVCLVAECIAECIAVIDSHSVSGNTIQTLYYMALLHLTCINFKWYKTLWLELSLALLVQ